MTVEDPIEEEEEQCPTCSVCHSRLVKFSDIHKTHLRSLQVCRQQSTSTLNCAACGSQLCPLSDLTR